MPVFTPIAHAAFVDDVTALATAIRADAAWAPTYIVGIGRGGLVPAVYLSHATGLPMLSCDWSSQVTDFAGDVVVRLAGHTQRGERLLFVDDINDSGLTIGALRTALTAAGAVPGSVRVATLIDNRVSAQRVDYHARAIDRTVTKDWYVFPWEAVAPDAALHKDAAAVPERIG